MDIYFLSTVISLNIILPGVTSKITEITVKENNAANFYLPNPKECGEYNFTDPYESVALEVSADGSTAISRLYTHRSTVTELENGTVVFTLHYITRRDEGTFGTHTLRPNCLWYFAVAIFKEDPRPAFWEKWNEWSRCSSSCGPGERIRERECSITGKCHGQQREADSCMAEFACPYWGSWGSWTSCSVSCDSGERRRDRVCLSSEIGVCVGESSQVVQCMEQPCTHWDTWSAWSHCSTSCGQGQSNRHRQCLIGTEQAHYSHCVGDGTEARPCTLGPCRVNSYFWSSWSAWSHCSETCGVGNQERMRSCLLSESQQVRHEYCNGEQSESQACQQLLCSAVEVTNTGYQSTASMAESTDPVAKATTGPSLDKNKSEGAIPYTTVVGGAAAGFIIILLLVIISLLVRLKKKKDTATRRKTIYDLAKRQSKQVDNRASRVKSNIGLSEAESQMYAEIDDDFIDSEFDATSCNDYGPMPTSATPYGPSQGNGTSIPEQRTGGGNVFAFDPPGIYQTPHLTVPNMSMAGTTPQGGDGYEKPITCADRQRQKTYANVAYDNIIR